MNKYFSWLAMAGFAIGLGIVVPALAATQTGATNWQGGRSEMRGGMPSGVFGKVASISGDTLTVTQETRPNATTTPITYTIDGTNAKITKNGTTSTLSSIVTGDTVMVRGTVNGTSITATLIDDGMMERGGTKEGDTKTLHRNSTSTAPISPVQGNGEPVVGGSVSSISGTTVTITNTSNVTYAVDTSNAKIVKNGTTTTLSSVATGDNLVVQGTVNGTSVIASSVIDQGSGNREKNTTTSAPVSESHFNFFSTIGNFFKNLFGF